MNKKIIYIIVLAVIVFGAGWYWYASQNKAANAPVLNAAVYPLYPGATWGTAVATVSPDYGSIVAVQSLAATGTTDIAAVSTPFTKYYDDKLTAAGWAPDISREAGGPGAEVSFYTKDGQFIVVMFSSVFHNQPANAPEECPCDVTLSLMSGTQQPAK